MKDKKGDDKVFQKLAEAMKERKTEAKDRIKRTVELIEKAFKVGQPMPIAVAKTPEGRRVVVSAMPDGTIKLDLYDLARSSLGVRLESDDIAMEAYYEEPRPIED